MNQKDHKYFAFHYSLLRYIGLGYFHDPKEKDFRNFSKPWYLLYSIVQLGFWTVFFTAALWMEVPYIYNDLDRLMLNLSFSVTFTTSFVKLYIVIVKNKTIQNIVHAIEHDLCDFPQNEKILRRTVIISTLLTYSVLGFANLTVLGMIVGGTVQAFWSEKYFDTKNNTLEFKASDRILPLPVYVPFEITSDLVYAVAFVYQILGIQWYGNAVVLINTFIITIMVHMAGKFENLNYYLENIKEISILRLKHKKSKNNLGDIYIEFKHGLITTQAIERNAVVEESITETDINKEMCICLKECIKYHICLLSYVEKIEDVYNIGFLTHVLNNLNVICHVMIQISENDIFSFRCGTAIALFFTVVSELLVQCYAGNELTLQAEGLAESAYNCCWYSADKDFKRQLTILMMRAQKPAQLTAGKFVAISNATFVAIMRGAYSFFAVIKSTKET